MTKARRYRLLLRVHAVGLASLTFIVVVVNVISARLPNAADTFTPDQYLVAVGAVSLAVASFVNFFILRPAAQQSAFSVLVLSALSLVSGAIWMGIAILCGVVAYYFAGGMFR